MRSTAWRKKSVRTVIGLAASIRATHPPQGRDGQCVSLFADLGKGADVLGVEELYDGELHLGWELFP